MERRLNEIKKQVESEEIMNPPSPSGMSGMRPSIIQSGDQEEFSDTPDESTSEEGEEYESEPIDVGMENINSQPNRYQPNNQIDLEKFQLLAENIIHEKWEELISSVGNITLWKEKMSSDIISMKQEIIRIEERFENLQKAILGRVEEYHKTISDVGTDVKALEQVFEKILQPLTSNIKELNRITEDLKKRK